MTLPGDDRAALSPVKQALLEIRDLRARLAAVEAANGEPIAVVGMACRLPGGVHDEASLWRVLAEGVDTIAPVPRDRWDADALHDADPEHPGTMSTREGGFLDDVAGFDAAFFGIAPLEAGRMDPQQRLVLETAWHALEDAGIAPDSLSGSRTGVFVGVGNSDYGRMMWRETEHIDAYAGSGGSLAVVAGRLSYVLGLQGPALSIDTACSSSLVALHLACQSLRGGECDLAMVAGVNLILTPEAHIAFSKARMMAPDGRCKTFDAAADGYGRGEGAVMLVLQRAQDARAAGARQLALVRGSAVNQDGRSGGLTAPNGPAQEAVIRAALAQAGLAPADIDVVEAHGTGTPLGDPIELQALAAALGAGRAPERPLLVGSCKTNFGHLEAAAGLAGVAKIIAALRRRQVPPHLHLRKPNPLLDWDTLPLAVPTSLQPWPAGPAPARAGVSSFGFSGTNAHVILEGAESASMATPLERPTAGGAMHPPRLLSLSARDEPALHALAQAWQARLAEPDAPAALNDLCFTANTGRARLPQRLALRGADAKALHRGLARWLDGAVPDGLLTGRAASTAPKVAFLFTGQGAQFPGMGRDLYERAPVFRETLDRCAAVIDPHLGVPLVELLYGDAGSTAHLEDTACAQPALFALEVALAALLRSFGITPTVVLGHSLGEYAAACVAGIFPLEDALRVLVRRGQLTRDLPGDGAMISVQAGEAELRAHFAALGIAAGAGLDFAAFNGARQVVVSGARAAIERLGARLDAEGTRWRALRISQSFHSSFVEPAMAPLGEALACVQFSAPRCAIVSNVSGALASVDEMARSGYWQRQMRAPVRFADGLRALLEQGVTHVLEIGPHPVLLGLAAEEAPADSAVHWLPTLRRDATDGTDLLEALQRLHVDGATIDWAAFVRGPGLPGRRVAAPVMPFQRRRHWLDQGSTSTRQVASGPATAAHVWQRMGAALARQSDQAPIGTNVQGYRGRWAVLEGLTVAHAATVLRDAGMFAAPGERHDVESVRRRLGAKDTYAHLLERWLQRLAAGGELRAEGKHYVADRPLSDPQLEDWLAKARAALADNPAQLAYMLHCGRLLADVIGGRESPLETLFPGGSFELAEGIYQRSSPMRYVNALATSGIEALLAARPLGVPLRVLEIGAGTGSTTAALMPPLAAWHAEHPGALSYCYTDVTPVFFDLARVKFAHCPFMRFTEFDLERDTAAQGFTPASFDLVISANAVHAARDLRHALDGIRSLLAPGGVLLLVESTEHLAWYDMTTGLIEGWQHFADDLRTDNPLLPAATWLRALRDAGFSEAGAWPPPESEAAALGQQVIAGWLAGVAGEAAIAPAEGGAPSAAGAVGTGAVDGSAHGAALAAREAGQEALRRRLREATPEEQHELLRDMVRDIVAAVLRLGPDEAPGRHDRLMDLGMDSLMAVQLRNRFGGMLGLAKPLPATLLFDQPTIEALAAYLHPLVGPDAAGTPAPVVAAAAQPPGAAPESSSADRPVPAPLGAERIAEMSDEEVERLLLARLDTRPQ